MKIRANTQWGTLVLTLAMGLGLAAQTSAPVPRQAVAPKRTTPALVVMIVIDQFRGDYVQLYGKQWTKGLHRIFTNGAYFPLGAYPYSGTVTCAGHTTIGTGAYPRTHGMIGNAWFDRESKKSTACTADATVNSVPFGGLPGVEHHGPKWLQTTTFADELRIQSATAPRIASFSLKARSSIGMVGHAGDLVVWEEDSGTWATSSAFAGSARPDVDAYAKAHAVYAQYGRVWDRLMPVSAYLFNDDGVGEVKNDGGAITFPHPQTRPEGKPDQTFALNWERSPFADEALADMAITFSEGFGKGAGTDMLAVSFSALDFVGHRYGPKSHEVQDVLARLDLQLGKLFDTLDRRLGAANYVVALSADHGIAPIPEQITAIGLDAGRLTAASVHTRITDAFKPFATDATSPIASGNGSDIYFTPAAMAILRSTPAARHAVTDAALTAPGIARAYWGDDLAMASAGDDAIKRAAILSYSPGRSADLQLILKQYWMVSSTGTTHGTPYAYDQRVPVALMGFGIRPGQYLTSASPADLAPTLALLTGIILPRAEGRPLTEAVVR